MRDATGDTGLVVRGRSAAGHGAGGLGRRLGCSARPGVGLAIALGVHLAWVLANLFRLEWWLRHRSYADPPEIGGPWGDLIALIVRLHRRKRFHKQRFVQLLRQLQRSTAALPDGVVILNAQREIVWFNRTAARLLSCAATKTLACASRTWCASRVRALPGGGQIRQPDVIRPTSGVDSTCRCRSCPTARDSCCCWCATSPGRRAWRRAQGLRRQRLP